MGWPEPQDRWKENNKQKIYDVTPQYVEMK